MKIYIIGSLRNVNIPEIADELREDGHDVFDDWHAAGPRADDCWREYEILRGRSYTEALHGHAATHVFEFDKSHIDSSDAVVLALPAGKSGHLEFGYAIGQGKKGYILLDKEYDRWDVMYKFATGVFETIEELRDELADETIRFALALSKTVMEAF